MDIDYRVQNYRRRLGTHARRTTEGGSDTMYIELQKKARKPCTQNYRRRPGNHARRTTEGGGLDTMYVELQNEAQKPCT